MPDVEPGGSATAGLEGETFLDPEGDYRMTVSSNWEANHGTVAAGIELWFTGPPDGPFRPNINVLTQAVGAMDLETYTRMSLDNAPAFVSEFELVGTKTQTGATGTELAVSEYRGKVGASSLFHFLAVWTVSDGQAIVVTLTAPPETYASQRKAWLPYLLTIEPT